MSTAGERDAPTERLRRDLRSMVWAPWGPLSNPFFVAPMLGAESAGEIVSRRQTTADVVIVAILILWFAIHLSWRLRLNDGVLSAKILFFRLWEIDLTQSGGVRYDIEYDLAAGERCVTVANPFYLFKRFGSIGKQHTLIMSNGIGRKRRRLWAEKMGPFAVHGILPDRKRDWNEAL